VDEDRHGDERQHELDGAHGQGGEFPRCAGRHGEDDKKRCGWACSARKDYCCGNAPAPGWEGNLSAVHLGMSPTTFLERMTAILSIAPQQVLRVIV
jgi:hypothetical protein